MWNINHRLTKEITPPILIDVKKEDDHPSDEGKGAQDQHGHLPFHSFKRHIHIGV